MNTLLKFALGLGVVALAVKYGMEPENANVLVVTDKFGTKVKVKSVNNQMCYYYDRSWIPLKYLGPKGSVVRGSKLVEV